MLDFSRVKSKLLVEHPYFGTLAAQMELIENENIETFTSDATSLQYSPEFFEILSDDEAAFTLANAAMHTILSHPQRRGKRSPWLWREACDYAINDMLIGNRFVPPVKIRYDERFAGKYAEEIYEILKDEISRDEMNEGDSDPNRTEESFEKKLEEAKRERIAQDALSKSESMGRIPQGLERLIPIAKKGKVDWRSELRDTVGGYYISDYTLLPPSKKLLYQGIYLPGTHSRHLSLAIAIDSSGSVDEAMLSQFVAEIESITELFGSYTIELMVCDDRLRSRQSFTNGETISYTLIGGGGTDFTPVFENIDTWMYPPAVLLYFTDLEGKFPPFVPRYETLWITAKEGEAPFGRVISMKDENG